MTNKPKKLTEKELDKLNAVLFMWKKKLSSKITEEELSHVQTLYGDLSFPPPLKRFYKREIARLCLNSILSDLDRDAAPRKRQHKVARMPIHTKL